MTNLKVELFGFSPEVEGRRVRGELREQSSGVWDFCCCYFNSSRLSVDGLVTLFWI